MKGTAKALWLTGAVLALAAGCGGGEVEASGFARAPAPEPERGVELAVAGDRPVQRAQPLAAEPAQGEGTARPGAVAPPVATGEAGAASPAGSGAGLDEGETGAAAPGGPARPTAEPSEAGGREARARELLAAGSPEEAARALSDLIQDALNPEGGGEDREAIARWVEALDQAQARHRWSAGGAWPSVEASVEPGEGLIVLRKRVLAEHPELLTCTGQIARANQLPNPDALQPGDTLRIPAEHANVLVDLSARWAFYRFGTEIAAAWPVGVGKPGKETPPGEYTVGVKQERPPWHPRGQPMVPYGDPENPLGSHWVAWVDGNGRPTDIGFHGTGDESGVGSAVSRGCLRLRNADVEVLHDTLPQGAHITVQP